MKKTNLILSFILLSTIVFPAYAVDDGDTKFVIQQDVGIKTKNPTATLHLNGTGLFEDGSVTFSNTSPVTFNSLALVNNDLQIPTGAAPGFVLVSDATGVASWADPTTVTSAGDDLGNHTATTNLDMATSNIINAGKIGINTANPMANIQIRSDDLINGGILVGANISQPALYGIIRGPGKNTGISPQDSFRMLFDRTSLNPMDANDDYLIFDKTDGNEPDPDGGIAFTNTGNDGVREVSLSIKGNGFVGLGVVNQRAKLDVGGGVRNFIDGIDDILVKDDIEVDGSVYIASDDLNNGGILVGSTVSQPALWGVIRGPGQNTGVTPQDSFRVIFDRTSLNPMDANDDYLIFDKTDGNEPDPDGGIAFTNTGNDGVREVSLSIKGNGFVGLGVVNQKAKLDVGGGVRNFIDGIDDILVKDDLEVDGSVYIQDDLILTKNPGAGKILVSDKNGKAMWSAPAMVQTNGDNLGNHTANRNLDMASNDITSVKNITATSFNGGTFKGDGSGLTNVKSSVFKILSNTILNNGSQASYTNNFLIGSPGMNDTGNSSHDSKLFFNKAKGAFRAGTVDGNTWNDVNVGLNSTAFGKNTRASGASSFAVGNGSVATGLTTLALGSNSQALGTYSVAIGFNTLSNNDFSLALGTATEARGVRSTAFGNFSKATGFGSTAFGNGTLASGIFSTAFGNDAQAINANSVAIGEYVKASGNNTFSLGHGNSKQDPLTNSINNSLAIGFATNQATLFVGPGVGTSTDGKVGIGTNTPQDLLDVDGRLRTKEFRMPTGAANNFVLTSDGVGRGTWKSIAAIGGTGDNLGNHTATQTLDMDNNDIKDVKNLNASTIITNNTSPGAFGTRLYAQIPASAGFADFVTGTRQTSTSPPLVKWAVGSTGDTRDISNGGGNTFYIYQKTNKNDVVVNGYRLAIDDTGLVGIGLHNPKAKLDVGGGVRNFIDGIDDLLVKDDVEVDGTLFTNGFRMPTGAANNLVLTSDASGSATWKSLGSLPGNGDNLGNHTATTHLNMATRNIVNAGTITATNFGGSGGGLTNLNAGNVSSGVLNIARIPDLNASKITAGVFDIDRIPNIPSSKIIGGTGDDLGDHTATQTLDMDNNDIKDVKYLNAVNILTHNNAPGAFGTRLYAQVPASAGYADFVTVSRQTPASPLLVKWALGSTGDTRDISDGGANTFYIHQRTNKNDVAVNGYRLAIDDTGLVGIGLHNPKAKLDVGGGVRNFIDGIDDLLVKDDVEVDGTLFTSGFRMPTGAANNLVLTSDASGSATWKSLASLPSNGDNLGNHTATTHLNMATRNIVNAGTITATNFGGSGSGLTDLNAGNVSTGVLNIARIPDLNASKTTAGVFDIARIPNIPATKITGTIDGSKLVNVNLSKLVAPDGSPDPALQVDNSGRVSIGTDTAEESFLHVANSSTRITAQHTLETGWSEFATAGVDNSGNFKKKWSIGSTGDKRAANFNGPNKFYVFQYTDKNDAGVNGYRMVIDDLGKVGFGTENPTEKLEVAGDVKADNFKGCVILQDGSKFCNLAQLKALLGPSSNASCGSNGYFEVSANDFLIATGSAGSWDGGGNWFTFDWTRCDKQSVMSNVNNGGVRIRFGNPPRAGKVILKINRTHNGNFRLDFANNIFWLNGKPSTSYLNNAGTYIFSCDYDGAGTYICSKS